MLQRDESAAPIVLIILWLKYRSIYFNGIHQFYYSVDNFKTNKEMWRGVQKKQIAFIIYFIFLCEEKWVLIETKTKKKRKEDGLFGLFYLSVNKIIKLEHLLVSPIWPADCLNLSHFPMPSKSKLGAADESS
jgi:hypothetical protein